MYKDYRVADQRIASFVHSALGDARTVLNIGAGTDPYEPTDREVTAVEPSATVRERRPAHLPRAIDASAELLPFVDGAFDAAMGAFTGHQWANLAGGLAEVRRVTRGEVAFLTCDPALLGTWCTEAWRTRLASMHQRRVSPELSETFAARSVYWAVEYRRPINVA